MRTAELNINFTTIKRQSSALAFCMNKLNLNRSFGLHSCGIDPEVSGASQFRTFHSLGVSIHSKTSLS